MGEVTFSALYSQACIVGIYVWAAVGDPNVGTTFLWIGAGIWTLNFAITAYLGWRLR